MFNAGVPCENVHSQARRMVMLSPEPNFWIHAVSVTYHLRMTVARCGYLVRCVDGRRPVYINTYS